ncbi:MAG: TonB-dependent receptor [Bacteroidota bacterium]
MHATSTYLLTFLSLFLAQLTYAQTATIQGKVVDPQNVAIPGITIMLNNDRGVATDVSGSFAIRNIAPGKHTLAISGVGYQTQTLPVTLEVGQTKQLTIRLDEGTTQMNEVTVVGQSETTEIESKGFNVEAVATRPLGAQSLDLNRVLDRTAGIRIRQSGGMGSDFVYSLDGMSGNSIRFFVDGIPMDYFGSSYSINNFPVSLVDRIDVYKGVVPVELGSDALGGAINLVTSQQADNFAEASYSFGSFNTHQAAVQGQWTESNSGLTTRLSAFYNYSDNNYRVWGRGVTYSDENFRPVEFTREDPAERFNDDFRTINAKVDVGFTNRSWADQFIVGAVVSDLDRGIQNGQTMAAVYGDVRYQEDFLMPFLTYQKDDILVKGLNTNLFASLAMKEGVTVDTSTNRYDWRGQVVNTNPNGGEINGNGKSLFTLTEDAFVVRWNTTYALNDQHKLGMNYVLNDVSRDGDDTFLPFYRIALVEPQSLQTFFGGLSYESTLLDKKLTTNLFAKYYAYTASVNERVLIAIDGEQQTISRPVDNEQNNWGGGLAASYKVLPTILAKVSVEQAVRMPNATEALGDGITIQNAPGIQPERSFNVNAGITLGKFFWGDHSYRLALTGFYRDTQDQLLFTVTDNQGNGQFQNIAKTLGKGAEFDFSYGYRDFLEFTANATYLDIRNNQPFDEVTSQPNIVYQDRLRNTPYLMANAGFRFKFNDLLQEDSRVFAYFQTGYVHEYFLGWPSLGNASQKNTIPAQLTHDLGVSYAFSGERFTVAVDMSNITNEQVYDNFLLQKPGRAFFGKLTYSLQSISQR